MYTNSHNSAYFNKDASFDYLYPKRIQDLSEMHWTPLEIAKQASMYLAAPKSKVLDIGSGVGKFCITGGFFEPETLFYGVEQRKDLFILADSIRDTLNLPNVKFIHKNITQLKFDLYDSFYFFNPFYENLKPDMGIDSKIQTSSVLYNDYTNYVYQQLDQMPSGTRLVTYHGSLKQVPLSYQLIDNSHHYALKFWMKE